MIDFHTPYIDANRNAFVSLLSDGVDPDYHKMLPEGEYGRYILVRSGKEVLFDSGILPLREVACRSLRFSILDRPGVLRSYFIFSRRSSDGKDHVSPPTRSPHQRRPSRKPGASEVTVGGPSRENVSARRKASRSVSRRIKSPRRKSATTPSSVRPNESRTHTISTSLENFSALGVYTISMGTASYVSFSRTWTGTRTPNFWSLAARQLPVNAHSVSMFHVKENSLLRSSKTLSTGRWDARTHLCTLSYAAAPEPQHIAGADTNALKNLIERAGNEIQANLAQDFAQIGQTVRLISNTVGRLTGAVRQVRRGNLNGAVETLWAGRGGRERNTGRASKSKSTASNWLELQYGWKPLLNDVHGSMHSLAKYNLASAVPRYMTATGRKFSKDAERLAVFSQPSAGKPGVRYTLTETQTKYGLRFQLQSPLTAFLAQTGFTNPVNLAWEILPFSFVLDWFLPIGPWLETLGAWHGLSFIDGYRTRFTRQETVITVDYAATLPGSPNTLWVEQARYQREWIKLNRDKLTSFPVAAFPTFKDGVSVGHTLNALALMRTVFGK